MVTIVFVLQVIECMLSISAGGQIIINVMCVLQDRCTPLYIASVKGFNEVVKSLLAASADVNCVCIVSCACMHICVHACVAIYVCESMCCISALCVCMSVSMHVYLCVHVCVYM